MSARVLAIALVLAASPLAAQQPSPQPPARAARPAPAPAQRPRAARDSVRADSLAPRIEYRREVFGYSGGPRDPFMALVTVRGAGSTVGPEVSDLRLVSIAYDRQGGHSVAVVREANNPRAHRLRRGDMIGRLRVIQIRQYEVVFQVEEFGFERQEVLSLPRQTEANR